jgi:hypothetical protein
MDRLLAQVLDAHGGLDRWSEIQTLTVRALTGGPVWAAKGWPDIYLDETIELDAHRQHVVVSPFPTAGQSLVLDVDPERVVVQGADGAVIERRDHPRASFAGFDANSPWDAVQLGYVHSYSVWNYLTAPFLFTYPGVQAREIEPWSENGQTWRRLQVTFPPSIATHNSDQVFYYDTDGMLRRTDYAPEVGGGAPLAQYTDEPKTFGGVVFVTRRRAFRRNDDGTVNKSLTAISVDFDDITVA